MSQFVKFPWGQNKLMPSLQKKKYYVNFLTSKKQEEKKNKLRIYMTEKMVWLENFVKCPCPLESFLELVANRISVKIMMKILF